MSNQRYLETFFQEKDLPYQAYEIIDEVTGTNYVDSEIVIALIMQAPPKEQETIAHTLRQIDFHNGDVHDYLKFLAGAFIRQQRAAGRLQ